ncbi:MAG: M48 family metalloprotease [Armatimonadetes bacterium]|nr:M48 family metalloprotease [Armatimonadota bacterium]
MLSWDRTGKLIVIIIVAVALLCGASALAASKSKIEAQFGENEVKMGQEAANQIAKDCKLSDNAADLKHLREIGEKLAAIANKKEIASVYGSSKVTPFQYTFNIVEDDDVNAFSVPGGFIYVHRGLLNYVQTDQELAAVLAHEIIHAAHHHMVYLLTRQASLNNQMAIALLATMLAGARSTDLGNVLLGVQLIQIAKLNGYGMQAERDSDAGGIVLAHDAGYNPVGLLTFLERLAKRTEVVDYGIYRSHPLDADRVKAAKNEILAMNLPINRRDTTKAIKAEVKTDTIDGAQVPGIWIDGKLIYRPARKGGKTSDQRAQEIAYRINKALDDGIQMHELTVDALGGVIVRGKALITVSDEDAKLMKMTPAEVAKAAATAIRNVVWKQMVDTIH